MFHIRYAKHQNASVWVTLSKKFYIKTCPNINCYFETSILIVQDIVLNSFCKPPSRLLSPTADNIIILCTFHSYRSKGLICDVTRSLAPYILFFGHVRKPRCRQISRQENNSCSESWIPPTLRICHCNKGTKFSLRHAKLRIRNAGDYFEQLSV